MIHARVAAWDEPEPRHKRRWPGNDDSSVSIIALVTAAAARPAPTAGHLVASPCSSSSGRPGRAYAERAHCQPSRVPLETKPAPPPRGRRGSSVMTMPRARQSSGSTSPCGQRLSVAEEEEALASAPLRSTTRMCTAGSRWGWGRADGNVVRARCWNRHGVGIDRGSWGVAAALGAFWGRILSRLGMQQQQVDGWVRPAALQVTCVINRSTEALEKGGVGPARRRRTRMLFSSLRRCLRPPRTRGTPAHRQERRVHVHVQRVRRAAPWRNACTFQRTRACVSLSRQLLPEPRQW